MANITVRNPDIQELMRLNKLRLALSKLDTKDIPIKDYMAVIHRCRVLQDEIKKRKRASGSQDVETTGDRPREAEVGKPNPLGVGV